MSLNMLHDAPAGPHEQNGENKSCLKKLKNKKTKAAEDGEVDTSNFTIEERLVSAVWVHERKLHRTSIAQIKINFRVRFGKPPPTKNTLYFWEKKLFSTGKVMDAKRSGRPCRRKAHIPSVEASLQQAPGLSLRARAEQLSLPRTTLKKILKEDLHIRPAETIQQTNVPAKRCPNTAPPRQIKPPPVKPSVEPPHAQPEGSADISKPPAYSYPEPHVSLPLSAFQHYLTYPNTSHQHHQINTKDSMHNGHPAMMGHQQPHSMPGHHSYMTNGHMDKTHLTYQHSVELHGSRNLMPQGFHT